MDQKQQQRIYGISILRLCLLEAAADNTTVSVATTVLVTVAVAVRLDAPVVSAGTDEPTVV